MRISDWSSDLCGSRQNVRTEIYAEGSWMELPIGLDSITIIPGTLAQRAFGLQPTLHRVLHRNDDEYIEKDDIMDDPRLRNVTRSEEHTSELQSLMRNSYAVFCLKNKQ